MHSAEARRIERLRLLHPTVFKTVADAIPRLGLPLWGGLKDTPEITPHGPSRAATLRKVRESNPLGLETLTCLPNRLLTVRLPSKSGSYGIRTRGAITPSRLAVECLRPLSQASVISISDVTEVVNIVAVLEAVLRCSLSPA